MPIRIPPMRILPLGERRLFCRYFSDYIQIAITDTKCKSRSWTSSLDERQRTILIASVSSYPRMLSRKFLSSSPALTCILVPRVHNASSKVERFNFLNIHGTPCPSGERNRAPEKERWGRERRWIINILSRVSPQLQTRDEYGISQMRSASVSTYIHVRCNEILNYILSMQIGGCGELKYLNENSENRKQLKACFNKSIFSSKELFTSHVRLLIK